MAAIRAGQDTSDYEVAVTTLTDNLGDKYLIMSYRRMQPTRFGYPECRPRIGKSFFNVVIARQRICNSRLQVNARGDITFDPSCVNLNFN
jgi:hypothetical protein